MTKPSAPIQLLTVVRHAVGGIRTYLKYVYRHLPPERYHITVLTVKTNESHLIAGDLQMLPLNVVEVQEDGRLDGFVRALVKHLMKHPPDLIHSHGYTAGAITAASNLPFRFPHVMTSHDVFRAEQFRAPWGTLKAFGLSRLLGGIDVLQSVTRDAELNMLEHLPGLDKRASTLVILNGIDTARFASPNPEAARAWRHSLGLPPNTFAFGFLGRLMPQKGFDQLIEAVRLRRASGEEDFVIVVVSDGGFIREYRAQIEADGLSRYFHFAGFVADTAPVFGALDAIVIPSRWEACPLLPMEGFVAACPVIGSRCIGLREVLAESPAIIVPPDDAVALANSMDTMRTQYTAFKQAARDFVETAVERFDSRRVTHELRGCFGRLLERRTRRGVAT